MTFLSRVYALHGRQRYDKNESGGVHAARPDRKIGCPHTESRSNWAARACASCNRPRDKDDLPRADGVSSEIGRSGIPRLFAIQLAAFDREKAARIFPRRWQGDKNYRVDAHEGCESFCRRTMCCRGCDSAGARRGRAAFFADPGDKRSPRIASASIDGLNSPQPVIVNACVRGLAALDAKTDARNRLRCACAAPYRRQANAHSRAHGGALQKTTGQKLGAGQQALDRWSKSASRVRRALANPDGVRCRQMDYGGQARLGARLPTQQGRLARRAASPAIPARRRSDRTWSASPIDSRARLMTAITSRPRTCRPAIRRRSSRRTTVRRTGHHHLRRRR